MRRRFLLAILACLPLTACGGTTHATSTTHRAAPAACAGGYQTQYGCQAHPAGFGAPPSGVRGVAPSAAPSVAMADSVTVSALPHGLSAYAGYVNGNFENFAAIVAAFPGAAHVPVTVQAFPVYKGPLTGRMACLDIESGDAVPSAAGAWARGEIGLGVKPCLYANLSTMPAVRTSLDAAHLARSSYLLWVADWTGHPGVIPGFDATQWLNHGPNGENYDQNSVTRTFLSLRPGPKPVPDIGGAQHYERYPANAPARPRRERETVRGWDSGNGSGHRCMNPVRRGSCRVTRAHLIYDLRRDQALYRRASKKQRDALHLPGRIQGISHRINNRRGIVNRWL